jgi:hypothetical protein
MRKQKIVDIGTHEILLSQAHFEWQQFPWGTDYYFQHGRMAPADYLEQLRPGLNVHTIHAEVEGLRHLPLFEALLDALRDRVSFVRLIDVADQLDSAALPAHRVVAAPIAGRAGTVATQSGPA